MSGPGARAGGSDSVASPCIDVCRMHPASGLCEGCLRTLDEIAAWGTLGEAGRRDILARVAARREAVACNDGGGRA